MTPEPPHYTGESEKFPYFNSKVPICNGVAEFQAFSEKYPGYFLCPYLAYKDTDGWAKSTSRVYMNQVLPHLLYVPVNIQKTDTPALRDFFDLVRNNHRVVAVNITQPHKSNPILMDEFAQLVTRPENIDTLIRDKSGRLVPFDLNAPSFMSWYADEVGSMQEKTIILIGVGGVGEPIARRLAESGSSEIILVDPTDKSELVSQLQSKTSVSYISNLLEAGAVVNTTGVIVINAAGKEGATANSGLEPWLSQNQADNNVFVDLRPQLDIDIVATAKKLGWVSFTGYGMNARNDYSLLTGIANQMGAPLPTFTEFKDLVAQAS
jgi:shikimate 5-dehydrogenase